MPDIQHQNKLGASGGVLHRAPTKSRLCIFTPENMKHEKRQKGFMHVGVYPIEI
jgi:hypothetical protein